MLKKKSIIFHVNSQEQYHGEFHVNTKIRMLKSFFKDVSHISQFKFIFNGEVVTNDEMTIKELTRGSSSYETLIKIAMPNMNGAMSAFNFGVNDNNMIDMNNMIINNNPNNQSMINLGLGNANSVASIQMPNNNSNNEELIKENYLLASRVKELEMEILNFREQSEGLFHELEEMRGKLAVVQKAYDNVSLLHVNANKANEQLKFDYQKLEAAYLTTKEKLEKYQNERTRRSIIGEKVSPEKPVETTPNNLSILNTSIKRNSNLGGNKILTPDRFPATSAKKSILINRGSVSSGSNLNKTLKENGGNTGSINIAPLTLKKKSIIGSIKDDKLANGYHTADVKSNHLSLNENYSVDMLKKTNSQLFNFKPVKSESKNPWNKILTYLTPIDQYNVSQSNKSYLKNVISYWYDLTNSKLENINNTLLLNKKRYSFILEDQHFQLSASANSALKILNNAKYLDIFSKEDEYFENANLLPIYKIIIQLMKVVEDVPSMENKELINLIKSYFKEKSNSGGLGEFIKSLPNKCDFSDLNIIKIRDIMSFYNLATIDCGMLGKLCKTTGIIAFFVKDAMSFCGLDTANEKKPKDSKGVDRVNVIKDNLDIHTMKNNSEKIIKRLDGLFEKLNLE